jgi:uncharacterized membrane protein
MTAGTVRHAYLDWVRGVAVLIMIEAHVLDAWTSAADRTRPVFGYAMILGGFGAPLFLFLAGVAVALSGESKLRKTATGGFMVGSSEAGWQIFGLAFLFRLQSYILSGGYSAISLLKVDILNVMGPAIALAALTGRISRNKATRGALFAAAAVAISLAAPVVRVTPLLAWLPDPVEWYLRPSPGRTNFTMVPWAGFVFAGLRGRGHRRPAISRTGETASTDARCRRWAPDGWHTGRRTHPRPPAVAVLDHLGFLLLLRVGLLILILPIGYLWEHTLVDISLAIGVL